MIINQTGWEQLRKDIEHQLKLDGNITDVDIRYQIRKTNNTKNISRFNVILK